MSILPFSFADMPSDAKLPQTRRECADDLPVKKPENLGPLVHQSDPDAQQDQHGSVLDADQSRSHDKQMARHPPHGEKLIGIEDTFAVDYDVLAYSWPRTYSNEELFGGNGGYPLAGSDFDRVRIQESSLSREGCDLQSLQLRL